MTAHASLSSVAPVALVSVTVTARAIAFYTDVRCPNCHRIIMGVPGNPIIETRAVRNNAERSGRGRVVKCNKGGCQTLFEVIEHKRSAVA